jgi:hypothetical protein
MLRRSDIIDDIDIFCSGYEQHVTLLSSSLSVRRSVSCHSPRSVNLKRIIRVAEWPSRPIAR